MEISADKAYWLLRTYASRAVRLRFGGRIAGEEAACDAVIVAVDREMQVAVIELLEADDGRSWSRTIPLRDATFHLSMLGELEFADWTDTPFHLVMVLRYPDETRLFLAEGFRFH